MTYIDDDDPSYDDLSLAMNWAAVRGPRKHDDLVNLSVKWNLCYEACSGEILMHCGDDIVFRTPHWDTVVREAFSDTPDNILFAFGRDGYQDGNNFGTHGFVHRTWVETVGFFVPPYFVSDFNDTFLNDVAKLIGRHREIDIYTEHMHYICGKAPIDQNTRERLERHEAHRPQDLYHSDKVQELIRTSAKKLQGVMDAGSHV
ncbi:hypothetical protein [Mycolicibacterium phlei]|uniref:hypothetical protein n=1 Tax=Mycolicibacterium phlei TaxID=1771 RepID=UPI0002DFBEFE|nr:hypothetical protein [Mycolicibacterium phlei]MBF4194662.1 hypothetical protein [Mycolicibacterium phlei]